MEFGVLMKLSDKSSGRFGAQLVLLPHRTNDPGNS